MAEFPRLRGNSATYVESAGELRVSCALGTCLPPCHPLAALGLAKPSRALAEPRRVAAEGREGLGGVGGSLAPTKSAGEARLRQRDDEEP